MQSVKIWYIVLCDYDFEGIGKQKQKRWNNVEKYNLDRPIKIN
jgi:hypothetical protein